MSFYITQRVESDVSCDPIHCAGINDTSYESQSDFHLEKTSRKTISFLSRPS